jgi:SAM-dependent methyltransferase
VPREDKSKEPPMDVAPQTESEQAKLWNGVAGRAWVELQALLDHVFKPFEDRLLEALGANGRCIGIDISEAMIAAARARAEREISTAQFICADAQSHGFEPASLDLILSRFGVMFFDNPVAAFANLRHAAMQDAELRFLAWRSPAENPFMTTAERAAAPLMPKIAARAPDAPGQFAFAHSAPGSSSRSGPLSIPLCTRRKCASRRPAGWCVRTHLLRGRTHEPGQRRLQPYASRKQGKRNIHFGRQFSSLPRQVNLRHWPTPDKKSSFTAGPKEDLLLVT